MSSRVGLVKPNDHIVVVQMISDSLVVKASPPHDILRLSKYIISPMTALAVLAKTYDPVSCGMQAAACMRHSACV